MENHEQEIRQDREDLIEGRNAVAEALRAGRREGASRGGAAGLLPPRCRSVPGRGS